MDPVEQAIAKVMKVFEHDRDWNKAQQTRYRRVMTKAAHSELKRLRKPEHQSVLAQVSRAVTEIGVALQILDEALDKLADGLEMEHEDLWSWVAEGYRWLPIESETGQINYDATIAALVAIREFEGLTDNDSADLLDKERKSPLN